MSPEWFEWLRKNIPPHMFEAFERDRIHGTKWRDDEISRIQSALAAETKRREEAEADNARLREALEAVEYRGEDDDCCPICMAMRKEGHSNECIIGSAIAPKGKGGA